MTVRIVQAHALDALRGMEAESVQCCVTSPPYWGLRDYGSEPMVWGGDEGCGHEYGDWGPPHHAGQVEQTKWKTAEAAGKGQTAGSGQFCSLCGAWRGHLGLEPTPELYVSHIVEIFREVRRVLRKEGTLWLNLGDCYAAGGMGGHKKSETFHGHAARGGDRIPKTAPPGLKPKDLVMMPARVALALQADGWWLRSDIIWSKPNPMPESVTDRPTRAHEYIFLLTKSARYFYDADAIREQPTGRTDTIRSFGKAGSAQENNFYELDANKGANKRTIWTVATQPFPEAHFATFPPKLIEPCILAGCPEAGKRCDCEEIISTPTGSGMIDDPTLTTGRAGMNRPRRPSEGSRPITRREQRSEAEQIRRSAHQEEIKKMCGPGFAHHIRTDFSGARPLPEEIRQDLKERGWLHDAPPCSCPDLPAGLVLDPFGGSGTVGLVADRLGREAVLVELNPEYCEMAKRRIESDAPLFAEVDAP